MYMAADLGFPRITSDEYQLFAIFLLENGRA